MPPSVVATPLTDQAGVEWVVGVLGVQARLDVDRTAVLSAAEAAKLDLALNYGSAYVYGRVGNRIALASLQEDWLAYWWASVVAAHKFSQFNLGTVGAALQAEFELTDELLKEIHLGHWRPATMPMLSGFGTALDNFRLDGRFGYKQLRREGTLSDGHRTERSGVKEDIPSRYRWEPNQ